ncbi:MAG: metallophosphoesterase [Gammaproteobacteria bacterium]
MKINYFSDIHLEFGWLESPSTDADLVVAAGDIGVGDEAVRWLNRLPQPVIYVAGNHEYYGGELATTATAIREACAGTNVTFLEEQEVVIDGIRFLGTTLWTDFAQGDRRILLKAASHMNDYQQIRYNDRLLKPDDILAVNAQASEWLHEKIYAPFDGKTVVVTHHAPSYKSWDPPPRDTDFLASYCNELDHHLREAAVDLWIHGHIHQRSDYHIGATRVVCNPRGYHGYQSVEGFNETSLIEV